MRNDAPYDRDRLRAAEPDRLPADIDALRAAACDGGDAAPVSFEALRDLLERGETTWRIR